MNDAMPWATQHCLSSPRRIKRLVLAQQPGGFPNRYFPSSGASFKRFSVWGLDDYGLGVDADIMISMSLCA